MAAATLKKGIKRISINDNDQKEEINSSIQSNDDDNQHHSTISCRPGKRKKGDAPRWYTQSYMIFLALREHPTHCLARTPLIKAAVALDERISKERNLPRVFSGKTPLNSASAVLTVNVDRYFIAFKPEGSRSTYFKLAYEPGSFDTAVKEYDKWMEKLIQHDWLYCFGTPKPEAIEKRKKEAEEQLFIQQQSSTCKLKEPNNSNNNNNNDCSKINEKIEESNNNNDNNDSKLNEEMESATAIKSKNEVEHVESTKAAEVPVYTLDELDLTNVPKRWQDILKVEQSTIPGAGQGLFATQTLPYNSPLGFYFGVPMTEDEFDSMKESVGKASEYSIMYRKTVLDATDDKGEPYTDVNGRLYCPFHFMNDANNMESANILFLEGYVVNQIIIWTKRIIQPGEELLVWYGKEVNRYWSPSKPSPTSILHTPPLSISSSSTSTPSKKCDDETP
ncbi:hypothetical protein BJ944DRAFT_159630 [Cunninghamella echinulata]|nr:hypothetical protein BJ944DRAFT_159630 [Cunninghamella echinulata]